MALASLDEIFRSEINEQIDDEGKVTLTATRTFNAFVTDPLDTDFVVRFGSTVPRPQDAHPETNLLRVTGVQITKEAPIKFVVVVSYRSPAYREGGNFPWSQPTEIEYSGSSTDAPIDEDYNGNAIVTKAGEKIAGVTRKFSDINITLTKNFLTFDAASFYMFADQVNSDTFLGFPPGTLLFVGDGFRARELFYEGVTTYYSVSVTLAARRPYRTTNSKAWYSRVIHEGYYCWNNSKTDRIKCVDGHQMPVDSPALLNSDGTQMTLPNPPTAPIANWLEWQVYGSTSFSAMGF